MVMHAVHWLPSFRCCFHQLTKYLTNELIKLENRFYICENVLLLEQGRLCSIIVT